MKPPSNVPISPVSRDRWARAAAYAGVACGYFAAIPGDPLMPFPLLLLAGVALWSLLFEGRFRRPFLSPSTKIALVLLGALIFLAFVGFQRTRRFDLPPLIARFLLWNAIVFVLSRQKSEYDLWTLAIISLSLFMIGGAFEQPAGFLPLLLVALFANLAAFGRLALLRCGPAGEQERRGWGAALLQFALVLEIGALVFFAFPRRLFRTTPSKSAASRDRVEAPHPAPLPGLRDPVATGGPDRTGAPARPDFLSLRSYSSLKKDPTPILRLRATNSANASRYLRGSVLDTYERGNWKSRFAPIPVRADADGWARLPNRRAPDGAETEYKIWLEPAAGDLLFVFAEPVRVRLPEVRYDPAGVVFLPAAARETTEYEGISRTAEKDPGRLGPPDPRLLQFPPGLEGVRRLALDLTAREPTWRGKMNRLVEHFGRGGFRYSLAAFVPADGMDPVDYFLTRKREGFCVHFASALALLARAAGIPCRVVTGFHAESVDPQTGDFVVRNSDAHAWVEVDAGEAGWIRFDPTPAGEPSFLPEGEPVASGDKKATAPPATDAPEGSRRWDWFLLEFGPRDQGNGLGRAAGALRGWAASAGRFVVRPVVWAPSTALLVLLMVVYVFLPSRYRRRLRRALGGSREGPTVDFYRDFLWILRRRGIRKSSGQTGWEFAREARKRGAAEEVDAVTKKFYEVRYAGRTLTAEERSEIDRMLDRIQQAPDGLTPCESR